MLPKNTDGWGVISREAAGLCSLCLFVLVFLLTSCGYPGAPEPGAVPKKTRFKSHLDRSRILKFRGVLKDQAGERLAGQVSVLFAIYEGREGGVPLWQEVQDVEADTHGRFIALVGSKKDDGIPAELFGTESKRWFGMEVPLLVGESEQPRIPLVSTRNGLMLQRATKLVIPSNLDDQTQVTASRHSGDGAVNSPDQVAPTGRSKRRFHDRSP
jgi:hypothetical protein